MDRPSAVEQLRAAVVSGDIDAAGSLTQDALGEGTSPSSLLSGTLIPAMDEVGGAYERGDLYVPEMLVAARAMKEALTVLRPRLAEAGVQSAGRVVIGTVEGDLHDIGKDLVAMMLEGAGFEVVNLGTEVTASQFVEAVQLHNAEVLAMSALLTTTMTRMPEVVEALREAGLQDQVKVVVGGAPLSSTYAEQIGADGFAPDAPGAVKLIRRLLAAKES